MRISDSQHRVPLRQPASLVWPTIWENFCPWLNLRNIVHLLHQAIENDSTPVSGKGKKRALSPQPSTSNLKRARTDNGSEAGVADGSVFDTAWPISNYPSLRAPNCLGIEPHGELQAVPVWNHTLDIQPYRDQANSASRMQHKREEELFDDVLQATFGHIEEPVTVNLGDVEFFEYRERLVASTPRERPELTWICLLPTLTENQADGSLGSSSDPVEDLLMACHIMRLFRRTTVQGHMKIVVHPSTMSKKVPLRLVIELQASIIVPFIFEPGPLGTSRKMAKRFEQSKNQLLRYIYRPSLQHGSDAVVNIPFFYSNLRPAPLLLSKRAENAMQPKELIPRLLPFQCRSVAWLLHREGMSVTAEGKIVPSVNFQEYSFWDKIQEGNHTWHYNRLSNSFSLEMAGEPPSLGGILAEEPGLGKTLETIALMLLNPAPPERNPTVKRWDPVTSLEVSAVKVNALVKT